jgi:hypothetical protein
VLENKELRWLFGAHCKRQEVTKGRRELHNEENLRSCIRVIKARIMRRRDMYQEERDEI